MEPRDANSKRWLDFEWATVRLMPRVHRGEFINVGVILQVRTEGFLEVVMKPDWKRVATLDPEMPRSVAERHLEAFQEICRGTGTDSPVALQPPSERFHWLTAPRSAIVQTSPVHPGRCHDPAAMLEELVLEQC